MVSVPLPPSDHITDSQKLTADSIVELFQVILNNGSNIYIKSDNTVTWQGKTWEGFGIQMSGAMANTDSEVSRPKLTVVNPLGIFSALIVQGKVDNAQVIRFRVLGANLLADRPVYIQHSWRIQRIAALNQTVVTFELREDADGPNFVVPARLYIPPDFPTVSI